MRAVLSGMFLKEKPMAANMPGNKTNNYEEGIHFFKKSIKHGL
jgi:hypothetical protein